MDVEDSLSIIPPVQWPFLLSLFNGFEGKSASAAITTQILTKEKFPNFPVKIFAPYDDPKLGIIIVWKMIENAYEIGVYSMEDNPTRLMKALSETTQIDWRYFLRFCCMMHNISKAVNNTLIKLKFTKLQYADTFYAHMPILKAHEMGVRKDPDVTIIALDPKYAAEMDEVWPHRYPGSIKYFEFMLYHGFAFGLIGKKDKKLRGYVMLSVRGAIHALYVYPEYRRKKYASILVQMLIKKMASENRDVYSFVVTSNEPSRDLFIRLGFSFLAVTDWISKEADVK